MGKGEGERGKGEGEGEGELTHCKEYEILMPNRIKTFEALFFVNLFFLPLSFS